MENELKSENKWGNLGKNASQKRTKREKERGCVNDLVCMGSPKVMLKDFGLSFQNLFMMKKFKQRKKEMRTN